VRILGGGSNVIFSDAGFRGLVIRVATRGIELERETNHGSELRVQAGHEWDAFVEHCVRANLSGVECLSGIPGTAGGVPIQNVGAYGQEAKETIVSVRVYDRNAKSIISIPGTECEFGYRTSRFKHREAGRFIILDVLFALRNDSSPPRYPELITKMQDPAISGISPHPLAVRTAVLSLRKAKSMVHSAEDPDSISCGSFFTNPVLDAESLAKLEAKMKSSGLTMPRAYPDGHNFKVSAAFLVENAGFHKGLVRGGAGVSTKHALALINRGGTAADLLSLADEIKGEVLSRFGIQLEMEPEYIV